MIIAAIMLVIACVIHITGPEPSFFQPKVIDESMVFYVLVSLCHGFVEELIFRELFWSFFEKVDVRHIGTLVLLNTAIFWVCHMLVYHLCIADGKHSKASLYQSTSYNVSLLFLSLILNASYLENRGNMPLMHVAMLHSFTLVVWAVFLGGYGLNFSAQSYTPSGVAIALERLQKSIRT